MGAEHLSGTCDSVGAPGAEAEPLLVARRFALSVCVFCADVVTLAVSMLTDASCVVKSILLHGPYR
jgi:hypothetical protein